MKKLIAKRLIQYQGRTYVRGEALPANDPVMTAAWLRAGSAAWEEPSEGQAAPPAPGVFRQTPEREACAILKSLGVTITDEAGNFVGEEDLTEQLCVLGQNLTQEYEDVIPPAPGAPVHGELPEEGKAPAEPPEGDQGKTPAEKKGRKK